jgi:cleavage and polyadenylation specificity factor subunit 1
MLFTFSLSTITLSFSGHWVHRCGSGGDGGRSGTTAGRFGSPGGCTGQLHQLPAAPNSSALRAVQVNLDGITLWVDTSNSLLQPLVPKDFQRQDFAAIHGLSYPGIRATWHIVSSRYVWPNLAKDVVAGCKDCTACQAAKVTQQHTAKVQPIKTPMQQLTHLHVDLVGPLPVSQEDFAYLLTIVDRTTRWLEAIPICTTAAANVAGTIVHD